MGLLNSQENENIDIAKNMLAIGIDIDQVCQLTNLSREEIERIIEENQE